MTINITINDNKDLLVRFNRLEQLVEDLIDAVDNLADERPPSGALIKAVADVVRGARANDALIPDTD